MARLERIRESSQEWQKRLEAFPDRIVFQSAPWVAFLAETQGAEPALAVLKDGDNVVGLFTGLIVRKFGLKILGSPFRGWSTPYMGFNMLRSFPRQIAVEALARFAFQDLGCIHLEVTDANMTEADINGAGFHRVMHPTMEIDLTQTEEAMFGKMTSACRRNIRHAEKLGLRIEEAGDLDFADEFAAQFKDVFAKQGMVPHFGADRIRAMIRNVHPTGMLLLLRARDPEGRCIATGIYPAMHETAFYNNGASWRQYQKLRPNESLHWYAMRYWKQKGMRRYNMEGVMSFKQKFGGQQTEVPMIYKSKYRLLERLRSSAMPMGRAVLGLAWKLKALGKRKPAGEPAEEA